jgi:uncharacterized membrane protein
LLRNRGLGPRAEAVMQAAPDCVVIGVIAPYFVSSRPADLAALAVTVMAAARLLILATVAIAVAAAGLFRHVIRRDLRIESQPFIGWFAPLAAIRMRGRLARALGTSIAI